MSPSAPGYFCFVKDIKDPRMTDLYLDHVVMVSLGSRNEGREPAVVLGVNLNLGDREERSDDPGSSRAGRVDQGRVSAPATEVIQII